jgi:hypothetical protein
MSPNERTLEEPRPRQFTLQMLFIAMAGAGVIFALIGADHLEALLFVLPVVILSVGVAWGFPALKCLAVGVVLASFLVPQLVSRAILRRARGPRPATSASPAAPTTPGRPPTTP